MILVNIDSLSLSELQSIAAQEGIDGADSLSREDLISMLEEKYEEYDQDADQKDPNIRYMSGLTDYRDISKYVENLPGVEELPDSYPDTEIHLIKKNCSWLYAFWSLSSFDSDRLQNEGVTLALSVTIENNGKREEYDIPVSYIDSEWNIGIPYGNGFCVIALSAISRDGSKTQLAVSKPESLTDSYWLSHTDEMKYNDTLYGLYLAMVTTKEGELVDNPVVREIIQLFRKEDTQSE
ncbi:MAG: DUF4912 domain-containing protein [Spirochaetes bacterium]|uniref:DUF4912 domain-containing protein n=1 Tax=Candidatus Ornithospirochaeta stercoripullorum TaxID=2840899 RepID=A0A9D9E004_9SPIO|nr:DUF4912 domain-containing protein [Candidatus Ornithospirochaeta stercoripullorum]